MFACASPIVESTVSPVSCVRSTTIVGSCSTSRCSAVESLSTSAFVRGCSAERNVASGKGSAGASTI